LYGALYLIAKATSRQEVSVLLYHSIGSNGSFYTVNPEQFKMQMDYLRKNYRIVSLEEIMNFVEAKNKLPMKSVALTFDDGYYDNYINAYPYLRKYGLPATIFITVGYVGKQMCLDGVLLRMLNWNEIKLMSSNKVDIGSHTITHPELHKISSEDVIKEIVGSKREIEEVIGKNVDYFAYPSSRFNKKIINLVKSSGFRGAFGESGLIKPGDNPFCVKRISVDKSINFWLFKARLTVATEWYKAVEKYLGIILKKLLVGSLIVRAYNNAGK